MEAAGFSLLSGYWLLDLSSAMAPTVLVAALLHHRLTGRTVSIDLAQIEATAYTLGVTYPEATLNGREPQTRANPDPTVAPDGWCRCQGAYFKMARGRDFKLRAEGQR